MHIEVEEYLDRAGLSPFCAWFGGLSATTAARVTVTIERISRGLLGDVKSVGNGVSERRIDFGPGYRIYFGSIRDRNTLRLIILLGGGTKQRQSKDIEIAQSRWDDYKARRRRGEH